MRILQVIPVFSDPFGGPVAVVRSISKELAKRHDVVVYTTTALDSRRDFDPKEEEINGYRVIYFPRTLKPLCYADILGQLNLSSNMCKTIRSNLREFDVVHLHSWQQFPDVVVHHYATRFHVPYVLQTHGSLPRIMTKQKRKWVYDVTFGRRVLRDASKVIALTKVEAKQCKVVDVPEEKIEIIPNGIDLSEFSNLPYKASFKKKFGLDENERIILYMGRIHKIKGVDILVRAFANIVEKLNGVKLVIAGPDDGYLSDLEALIRASKIEENVLVSGPLYGRDKVEAYVDADVYVLPSRYETFPMSILEALACGTPIILTENCGINEYFRGKVGLAVRPDPDALSRALLEMLLNKQEMLTFRQNCRMTVEAFRISKTVSKLDKVYEDVAHN